MSRKKAVPAAAAAVSRKNRETAAERRAREAGPAKPQHHVTHRRERVTPEIAYRWLEQNTSNRNVNQKVVEKYARDMKAGRWHYTGEAIQFGISGRLLNGQKRLWACILADVPFEVMVIRGLEDEQTIQDVIDTGEKRTLANALQIHGEKDGNNLASIISMCWRYEQGTIHSKGHPTHEEGLEWFRDNPDVRQAVLVGRAAAKELKIAASVTGSTFYLNSRVDAEAAEEFWRLAASGEGLPAGSPILAFRRWILGQLARRERPRGEVLFDYALKAMAAWRDGRTMRMLIVRADERPQVWS